jgi:uncharacterized membrane protein YjgN (DUF898 family)
MLETELSASPAAVPPPSATPATIHPFSFHGSGAAFFALVLKNMLLTLLTFGLYLPWAKSERRQYLWQNIEIAGHRLRYHGTGKELLVAYAKVLLGYVLFIAVPMLMGKWLGGTARLIVQLVMVAGLLALIPYAIWGSQRYLLSRTSYRAARFRLDGEFKAFVRVLVGGYFLTLLTIGFYAPVWSNRIFRELTNASALGTKHFEYHGESRVVFWMAMKGLLLSLFTFGLYFFWYQAALQRYRFATTQFDGAHGQLDLTGTELLQLKLLQIFALTLTLGLAFPWVTVYTLRFYLARIRFVGPVDFARIHQTDARGDATADGLADALDVGIAL